MKEINKQHDQLSGHLGIIAVPLNNIKSIQGSNIEYYNPDLNYQINCSRESIFYTSPSNYSKAGTFIDHKIIATIFGRSSDNNRFLEEMLQYHFLVFLRNSDGNFTRIGDQVNGLKLSFQYTSSQDPNGQLGYEITFYGVTLRTQVI